MRDAGCAVPIINKGDFESFQIPLPPLPVQRRIADVLSAYDDLIENNRRRIAILEEAARLAYRKWFGGSGAKGGMRHETIDEATGLASNVSRQSRIPSLLAVAAVNKALAEAGVRPSVGIIVESGEVIEVHHFAVLLGFGATAINPWLALATVSEIGKDDAVKAASNYVTAVCKGIMKIMSKMGISTLRSYRSARIFEAVGLGPKLMGEYFGGVTSPVGGMELEDIEKYMEMLPMWKCCQWPIPMNNWKLATLELATISQWQHSTLPPGGEYRARKGGEEHLWNPQRLIDFREAVRHNDYARFKRYTDDIPLWAQAIIG